jgi:very-short-patch-repair endonuclease
MVSAMKNGSQIATRSARALRQSMSLPEVLLWRELKHAPVRFRRQHPLGPYIADFYCHTAQLVVEVDGSAHDAPVRIARDAVRDQYMASLGLRVERLNARDILAHPQAAADALVRLATHSTGA